MTIDEIVDALLDAVRLAHSGRYTRLTERKFELLLFGLFEERFGHMSRERHSSQRPSRIDLRYGTENPVLFELAVRPQTGSQQLEALQQQVDTVRDPLSKGD